MQHRAALCFPRQLQSSQVLLQSLPAPLCSACFMSKGQGALCEACVLFVFIAALLRSRLVFQGLRSKAAYSSPGRDSCRQALHVQLLFFMLGLTI